jgi:hypothetical protein
MFVPTSDKNSAASAAATTEITNCPENGVGGYIMKMENSFYVFFFKITVYYGFFLRILIFKKDFVNSRPDPQKRPRNLHIWGKPGKIGLIDYGYYGILRISQILLLQNITEYHGP